MDHQIEALLLRSEKFFVATCINEVGSVLSFFRDLLILYLEVNNIDVTGVIGHISRKDHPNHTLAQQLPLTVAKGLNEIILLLKKQLHRLTSMPVLLHCFVVISDRAWCHEVHMVDVSEAIVCKVMTRTSCDACNEVKVAELGHRVQTTLCNHEVQHLGDIGTVKIVMICNVLAVSVAYS